MKSKKNFFFDININIIFLCIVSFINDISSEMIMPILPMFIKSLGGTGIIIGLIGGIREGLASILKVLSGYWSDRTGKRKVFVYSGYLTSAIFKMFVAFAQNWQQLLVFSTFERTGKGLRDAPRDAMIADLTPKKILGKVFGLHRTMDTSGAILGSIIVFFLFWFFHFNLKSIFLISAIISFFALVPFIFIKEKTQQAERSKLKIGFKNMSKRLKLFILISGTFSLANFSYMFLILQTQTLFTGKFATAIPILLYILYNIFYAAFAIPIGILSDKIGRKKIIACGYFLFSLICLGFIFFKTLPAMIVLFIAYGMVYALIEGNQRACISNLAPEYIRATALGTFHTTVGIFAFLSSIIAGFLWHHIGPNATFIYGSSMSFLSVILFFIFRKRFYTID